MKQALTANIAYWCLWVVLSLWSCTSAYGQITLRATDYTPLLPHTDTVRISRYNAAIPALPQGAAQTWDLSSFADSADLLPIYRVPAAGYSFADSINTSFIGFPLQYNQNCNITDSGIYYTSRTYAPASYDIFVITGAFGDSLNIQEQLQTPLSATTTLALPATLGTEWSSNSSIDFNYEISFALYGYTRVPSIKRTHRAVYDTTTGYGMLAVKNFSGSRSDFLPVLQVTEQEVVIDSYFLAGAPMPGAVMSSLGLTQGKTDTQFTQQYYRIGELTPLAKVWYTNSSYTQAYKATTHTQRVGSNGLLTAAAPHTLVTVFPNPTVTGSVTVSGLPIGHYYYTIHTPLGQCIASNWLSVLDTATTLTLPQLLTGSYYINFSPYYSRPTYQCTVVIP